MECRINKCWASFRGADAKRFFREVEGKVIDGAFRKEYKVVQYARNSPLMSMTSFSSLGASCYEALVSRSVIRLTFSKKIRLAFLQFSSPSQIPRALFISSSLRTLNIGQLSSRAD